jgi:tetratricopeptide (TPR) repeat protein
MEQLTFLPELQELRGERKSARRAQRGRGARETPSPGGAASDQSAFDFERAPDRPRMARVLALPAAEATRERAEGWYRLGCELESSDPERARSAYERALAIAPAHPDAHLNLGCLDHEAGQLASAEAHYRAALAARADDVTARFDLAVALEDQQREGEARDAYLACLAGDPSCSEAHFNLARLAERAGDRATALRHLLAYRRLTAG